MKFMIGCNYWASNAGTEMWREWDENAVREDLAMLAANGVEYMRVFPNWRDFQPIVPVFAYGGNVVEYRLEGDRRPKNAEYLDEVMLARFETFCDLCEAQGIRLVVGLLTGWMSGRVFIPSALYGKNLYTDPTALLFEQRLIRGIVTRFRDHKAICAWDLGNECNCLSGVSSEEIATNWSITIANAIRAYDNTRPIVSGMHSLVAGKDNGKWTIGGQAEACDILTTHPYPYWVKFAGKDHIASFRTAMHATCENKLYSDIGGHPCLVEEIGTMGPMICDDDRAADFMRLNLLSNWAHGALGVMWWCANEQTKLTTDPYTRQMGEVELGMRYADGSPKPVLLETGRVAKALRSLNLELPRAHEDAVCILTHSQQQWGVAYMTYCLAKQAGLNLRFAWCEDELPESKVYLLPSITGQQIMPRERYLELCRRVEKGATLYISNDNGVLAEFESITGLRVTDSCLIHEQCRAELDGTSFPFKRERRYETVPMSAKVLARDEHGIPAISENREGSGRVYYVNFPLEAMLLEQSDAFDGDLYKIYRRLFADILACHEVQNDDPFIGVTLHRGDDGKVICVAVNYSPDTRETRFRFGEGIGIGKVFYGTPDRISPFDAVIFEVEYK
ncbi:MAG: cellulase family glycosylhydrolase [Clostridia bacterium]|nr:cellulase family glycosylhydrolase [Clostridia bacterium]